MVSKYAIVFPATKSYLPEARVLVKSLSVWHPEIPVYITTIDGPQSVTINDFDGTGHSDLNIVFAPKCDTEFRSIRTFRFKLAMDLATEHKVILLLDADMALFRKIGQFFRIAETGIIIGCSDSTLLIYEKYHFEEYGITPPNNPRTIHPFFSTVPLFVNPKDERTREFLTMVWENSSGNDLEVPNRIVAATGRHDEMMLLNSYQWTNIHHSMLKPETFVIATPDGLISHQGQHIYMIHGHWQDKSYLEVQLVEPMKKNYGNDPKNIDCALNCINNIKKEYDKYIC